MKRLLIAACVLATPALAEPADKYDRALERSVMKIVAERMGELRGGFGLADRPVLVREMRRPEPAIAPEWGDGLAPARERLLLAPVRER